MKTTLENPPVGGSENVEEPNLGQEPPVGQPWHSPSGLRQRQTSIIAALSIFGILLHLLLRFGLHTAAGTNQVPLLVTLTVGGLPLLYDLLRKLLKREFGS